METLIWLIIARVQMTIKEALKPSAGHSSSKETKTHFVFGEQFLKRGQNFRRPKRDRQRIECIALDMKQALSGHIHIS